MNDFKEKLSYLGKKSREEVEQIERLRRNLSIVSSIVIPAAIAVVVSFYQKISSVEERLFWIALIVLISVQVCIFIFVWSNNYVSSLGFHEFRDLYLSYQDSEQEKDVYASSLLSVSYIQTWIGSAVYQIHSNISQRSHFKSAAELNKKISEILSLLVKEPEKVFGFKPGEKWSFAVYIMDPDSNELKPVWKVCSANHPSRGFGRVWPNGMGRVGTTYQNATYQSSSTLEGGVQFTENGTNLDIPDDFQRPYDSSTYVSYVSCPIMTNEGSKPPLGVLIGTSDFEGRFIEANRSVISAAAAVLGVLLHHCGQDHLNGIDELTSNVQ